MQLTRRLVLAGLSSLMVACATSGCVFEDFEAGNRPETSADAGPDGDTGQQTGDADQSDTDMSDAGGGSDARDDTGTSQDAGNDDGGTQDGGTSQDGGNDGGSAPPVPSDWVQVTSGGGEGTVATDKYELEIAVGGPAPIGQDSTSTYSIRLGPVP